MKNMDSLFRKSESLQMCSKIRLLVMDVDGTLTDGKIYMSAQGELFKAFDIKDGYAIHDLLPEMSITPVIITGRESKIVENRCRELGIQHCYQGCRDKAAKLQEVAGMLGIYGNAQGVYQEIAYIGDDINDLPCMEVCGVKACPSDAVPEVKEFCDYICTAPGGRGAVREFIEWIVAGN